MTRNALWSSIAEALLSEIAAGHYHPGDKLPTEAALSARFGVNRHTVRQALATLATAGQVHSRRGAGVYVTARPTDYPLGRRVRFHQNISASGRTPSRKINHIETRPCNDREARALGLATGDAVHVIEGISLADGQPIAAFRSVLPAGRFPGLLSELQTSGSVSGALAAFGVKDYMRASTRITAKLASPLLALSLQMPVGGAILRSVAVNVDAGGAPVEFGTTWFAGERVTLTVAPD